MPIKTMYELFIIVVSLKKIDVPVVLWCNDSTVFTSLWITCNRNWHILSQFVENSLKLVKRVRLGSIRNKLDLTHLPFKHYPTSTPKLIFTILLLKVKMSTRVW